MGVKKIHAESNCLYYITFTCQYWLPLFQFADAYNSVYKWFDVITQKGFSIVSFVVMPNHIHIVVLTPMKGETVNRLVGNGKRFMAYEIIKRLSDKKEDAVLERLKNAVTVSEKARGKLHKVFRESFDAKLLTSDSMVQQKMNYIHNNPVAKNWALVTDRADYKHSSAAFYDFGIEHSFKLKNINELSDAK